MKKLLLLLPLFFVGCNNEQPSVSIHMKVRGLKSGRFYNITLTQPVLKSNDTENETDFVLIQGDN